MALHQALGLTPHSVHIQHTQPIADLAPHEDVAPQGLLVCQSSFLIDHLNAQLPPFGYRHGFYGLALPQNPTPGVRAVIAGDYLDQSRLAGAVVAEQTHNFIAAHFEVDVCQRGNLSEGLAHVDHLEQVVHCDQPSQ